jgi:hypothetical protein
VAPGPLVRFSVKQIIINFGVLSCFLNFEDIIELIFKANLDDEFFTAFCLQQTAALRPPPVPYIYQTPGGQEIDLRLFNKGMLFRL